MFRETLIWNIFNVGRANYKPHLLFLQCARNLLKLTVYNFLYCIFMNPVRKCLGKHSYMILITGEGGWFVTFRIFQSILFFWHLNFIVLFPFIIKYYHSLFIIIVFWSGSDRPSGLLLFVPGSLVTIFVCFFVLFRFCCSHARVFGKTLVHEFPMSYKLYTSSFARRNSLSVEVSPIRIKSH